MTVRPITEEDLQAFVDERLDEDRHAAVLTFLSEHPQEGARIATYCEQREQLRTALADVAHEPVPPQLNVARLVAQQRRGRMTHWRQAVAAALLLAVGGAGGWWARDAAPTGEAGVLALAQDAALSYRTFAPDFLRPVEIRADESQVLTQWAARRLGRSLAVPDLAASGYRFMGGRMVATSQGPALLYMYDDDQGTRLVMMARPMAQQRQARAMAPYMRDGVRGYAWGEDGFGFSLVGPVEATGLHPVADELRRQLRERT
ncbi:anti-sigma factor [Acidovorax sp.]|uniref:anti-sigma factor family protein n=1 Tax=Acidovorax sp. TaxID=1872122 RepID=UPI0025BBFA13|nr:anti-sigma factor [Acidovorax sp.]MBL7091457.1 anti-sigma factor [Acidovorax sp.]